MIYPQPARSIATLHSATPNVLELAIEAARGAAGMRAASKPVERGRILRRAADISGAHVTPIWRGSVTLDTGKAIQETLVADAPSAADCLEYFAGAVAAFNGEMIDLGGPFAYARPRAARAAASASASALELSDPDRRLEVGAGAGHGQRHGVQAFGEHAAVGAGAGRDLLEAGLPEGLFNGAQGYGDVGAGLVGHDIVAKVPVTGSVPTGRKVMSLAGSKMKHATMELGGKSPLIVFDDADLENAIGGAMLGNFTPPGRSLQRHARLRAERPA
ncbi:aldehyde dehydrogenase family protein [Mesorhizobium atlanticum]